MDSIRTSFLELQNSGESPEFQILNKKVLSGEELEGKEKDYHEFYEKTFIYEMLSMVLTIPIGALGLIIMNEKKKLPIQRNQKLLRKTTRACIFLAIPSLNLYLYTIGRR